MCAFCAVSVRICTSNYRAKLNLIMRFLLIQASMVRQVTTPPIGVEKHVLTQDTPNLLRSLAGRTETHRGYKNGRFGLNHNCHRVCGIQFGTEFATRQLPELPWGLCIFSLVMSVRIRTQDRTPMGIVHIRTAPIGQNPYADCGNQRLILRQNLVAIWHAICVANSVPKIPYPFYL